MSDSPAGAMPAPQDGLLDALVRSSFATTAVLTRIGAEHDLSLTQLRVLAILRDRQPRMSALAAYLGLERSTISGLVDRAEGRGLVRRTAHAGDGRSVEVSLSPDGAELAERLHAEIEGALRPLTGHLAPVEQRRLAVLLERLLGETPA